MRRISDYEFSWLYLSSEVGRESEVSRDKPLTTFIRMRRISDYEFSWLYLSSEVGRESLVPWDKPGASRHKPLTTNFLDYTTMREVGHESLTTNFLDDTNLWLRIFLIRAKSVKTVSINRWSRPERREHGAANGYCLRLFGLFRILWYSSAWLVLSSSYITAWV